MFDTRHDTIPRGLDDMEAGPILAGFFSSIDVSALSGHNRIAVMRAERCMASHHNTRMYQSKASVADAQCAASSMMIRSTPIGLPPRRSVQRSTSRDAPSTSIRMDVQDLAQRCVHVDQQARPHLHHQRHASIGGNAGCAPGSA